MTSNAIGPPPAGVASAVELTTRALTIRSALDATADTHGLTTGTRAADLLNLSADGLVGAMLRGELDGIVVDGTVRVVTEQVQARVLADATRDMTRIADVRGQARATLRGYLAARPLTPYWTVSRRECRPLVCARRGRNWVNHGVEFHAVVLRTGWLLDWALASGDPDLASVPTGPVWRDTLLGLPGVREVAHAVPLAGDGRSHRLSGWIRVDSREWTMPVPADVAALVGP